MLKPTNVQLIGNEIAIAWNDGSETFIPGPALRAASPSAETAGERDIFGVLHGGEQDVDYSGVEITGWDYVGNYAIRFKFSDRHATGLYSFDLLKNIGQALDQK